MHFPCTCMLVYVCARTHTCVYLLSCVERHRHEESRIVNPISGRFIRLRNGGSYISSRNIVLSICSKSVCILSRCPINNIPGWQPHSPPYLPPPKAQITHPVSTVTTWSIPLNIRGHRGHSRRKVESEAILLATSDFIHRHRSHCEPRKAKNLELGVKIHINEAQI